MSIASLLAVVLAGFLIGATGIGGVLLVPVLTGMGGIDAAHAIAASSLAFGFPGVAALWYLNQDRERMREAMPVVIGTVPGAALGAVLVHSLDSRFVLVLVTVTIFFAGLRRSEEHTSELQSLLRISSAVFCMHKKRNKEEGTAHME